MENKPLLSIYIPTYNRSKYVKRLIESIIQQEWSDSDIFEIVISDNVSDDDTEEIIKDYALKNKNIKYHKNEKNIWADKNILQWAKICNWEYVWIIWSDDFLVKWWLKEIINIIKESRPQLIIANYYELFDQTFDFKKIYDTWKVNLHNITNKKIKFNSMPELIKFLGSRQDISEVISCFSFISMFCFNRQFFLYNTENLRKEKKKDFDNYISKHYFGLPITIYSWLSEHTDIIFVDKIIIGAQRNNNESTRDMNTRIIKCYIDVLYTIFKKNSYKISFIPLFSKLIIRWCIFFIWNKTKKILIKLWIYNIIMKIWLKNSKKIIYFFIILFIFFIILFIFFINMALKIF